VPLFTPSGPGLVILVLGIWSCLHLCQHPACYRPSALPVAQPIVKSTKATLCLCSVTLFFYFSVYFSWLFCISLLLPVQVTDWKDSVSEMTYNLLTYNAVQV